jgi:hypothetical protein
MGTPATIVHASASKIDVIFVFNVFGVASAVQFLHRDLSRIRRGGHLSAKMQALGSETVAALRKSVYETLV